MSYFYVRLFFQKNILSMCYILVIKCLSKAHILKAGFPAHDTIQKVVKPIGRRAQLGEVDHGGSLPLGVMPPPHPFPFGLPHTEQTPLTPFPCFCHLLVSQRRIDPTNHRLRPWAKINLPPFKLCLSGVCHSGRNSITFVMCPALSRHWTRSIN